MTWFKTARRCEDGHVDAAQVNEGAEVDDRGNGALEAHALDELGEDFGASFFVAFSSSAAGQHDVVTVAIHLDDASFDFGPVPR